MDENNPFDFCILQTAVGKQDKYSLKAAFKSANILWQNVYVFKKMSVTKLLFRDTSKERTSLQGV